MPAQMDDITLIQHFVKGDQQLVVNRRLSIQPAQDMVQLLSRNGQLIAWAKHAACPARFEVRVNNEYAALLNQVLLEHHYMPVGLNDVQAFMQYEHHPVPPGYEMNYTLGKDLWKYWWTHRQQLTSPNAEAIMVCAKRGWASVTQVDCHKTALVIETTDDEVPLPNQDWVVWLKPTTPINPDDDKTLFFVASPPLSSQPRAACHQTASVAILPDARAIPPSQKADIPLIQKFVTGDALLMANRRLSIQPGPGLLQLLGRHGQLIAWAKHAACPARFGVRVSNEYAELLNQTLLDHHFMPIGLNAKQSFMQYEYHPVPRGHEMHYTQGRDLWKYWWTHHKRCIDPNPEEVLVFTQQRWSRITQVNFQETTLFIQTVNGEFPLQNQDFVVWIKPLHPVRQEKGTPLFSSQSPDSAFSATIRERFVGQTCAFREMTHESVSNHITALKPSQQATDAHDALDYVQRCSAQQLIIETPKGKVVVVGEELHVHAVG